MTIGKILVPIRGDGKGEAVLDHAIALARGYHAHIEALYCHPAAADMIPYGVVVPAFLRDQIRKSMDSVSEGENTRLYGLFEEVATRHGLAVVPESEVPPRDRVTLGWREAEGKQADQLGVHGRLADVIAVPRPDHEANLGFNTLYSALMNTGRPVLMCPSSAPRNGLPGHVAVAWNGSMEAARAVALGADLLSGAGRVTILTAGRTPGAVSADALASYLSVRGVKAGQTTLSSRGGHVGEILLKAIEGAGADMLLMGAYSHSRGRESLFGGVSQHVVDHAAMPVMLVH